jgi:hypothetical protein
MNMSYCRFQNTVTDLRDCYENLNDTKDLSREEQNARQRIIKLCQQIANEYPCD